MKCNLRKREASTEGSLLCTTCAEAIRRLLVIQRDASGTGIAASDLIPADARRMTKAGARDA